MNTFGGLSNHQTEVEMGIPFIEETHCLTLEI